MAFRFHPVVLIRWFLSVVLIRTTEDGRPGPERDRDMQVGGQARGLEQIRPP